MLVTYERGPDGHAHPIYSPERRIARCDVCGQQAMGESLPQIEFVNNERFHYSGDEHTCDTCLAIDEGLDDVADDLDSTMAPEDVFLSDANRRVDQSLGVELPITRMPWMVRELVNPDGPWPADVVEGFIGQRDFMAWEIFAPNGEAASVEICEGRVVLVDLVGDGSIARVWSRDRECTGSEPPAAHRWPTPPTAD